MFLLSSGGHIGAPKRYKGAWNVWANISETMGHKDLRLGQIVYILVFYNISFFWLLPLDGCQFILLLRDSEWSIRMTSPTCYPKLARGFRKCLHLLARVFCEIEEVRTSEKVYQKLFNSKKKEESKRKEPLVTWKMPKLVKRLAQKQEWCANHDASSRQVIVLKPLFCSLY